MQSMGHCREKGRREGNERREGMEVRERGGRGDGRERGRK